MQLDPIGVVRSCFGGKFGVPRQPGLCPSAWGRLVLHEPYRSPEALRGIEGFSHLWLIFGFHQTRDHGWSPTVRPPRLGGNQRVGVFASRSTFRPNGLGLSLVRLEGLDSTCAESPALLLGGLDLVDGTPVFDIKPYLPYAESPVDVRGAYAADEPARLEVRVADEAGREFERLPERARLLLQEALSLDPRPATAGGDPARIFGADLCGCNVRFRVSGEMCEIVQIETGAGSGLNA